MRKSEGACVLVEAPSYASGAPMWSLLLGVVIAAVLVAILVRLIVPRHPKL